MATDPPPGPKRQSGRSLWTYLKLAAAVLIAAIVAVLMLGSTQPNAVPAAPDATATPEGIVTPVVAPLTPTVVTAAPTAILPPDAYVPGHLYYVKGRAIYSVHHTEAPVFVTTGSEPAISPNGKQLAFILFSKNYQDLWLLDLKTHALTKLVDDAPRIPVNVSTAYTAAMPAWTDDGQSVVFSWSYPGAPLAGTANFDRLGLSITRCAVTTPCAEGNAVKLTTPAFESGGDYDAAPRPGDPATLLYSKYQYETARDNTSRSLAFLEALNLSTGALTSLTPLLDNISQPTWSPDGKTLLFLKTSDDQKQTSIWEMDFHAPGDPNDYAKAHLLIAGNSFAADPAFSPDGKDLAFLQTSSDGLLHLYISQIHLGKHPGIDHIQMVERAHVVDGDRLVWAH
ncbi:MAG: TolB family protein [Chloroflexota bacterium]